MRRPGGVKMEAASAGWAVEEGQDLTGQDAPSSWKQRLQGRSLTPEVTGGPQVASLEDGRPGAGQWVVSNQIPSSPDRGKEALTWQYNYSTLFSRKKGLYQPSRAIAKWFAHRQHRGS